MCNACRPILVGVASSVSDLLLFQNLAKFPFRTMDHLNACMIKREWLSFQKIIRMLGGLRVGGFPLYDTLQCTMIILWVNAFCCLWQVNFEEHCHCKPWKGTCLHKISLIFYEVKIYLPARDVLQLVTIFIIIA